MSVVWTYSSPTLPHPIPSIEKLNPKLNDNQIREVLRLIKNLDNNNTIINNKQFTKYLLEGCKIPVTEKGETKYITVNLVDFNNSRTFF